MALRWISFLLIPLIGALKSFWFFFCIWSFLKWPVCWQLIASRFDIDSCRNSSQVLCIISWCSFPEVMDYLSRIARGFLVASSCACSRRLSIWFTRPWHKPVMDTSHRTQWAATNNWYSRQNDMILSKRYAIMSLSFLKVIVISSRSVCISTIWISRCGAAATQIQ